MRLKATIDVMLEDILFLVLPFSLTEQGKVFNGRNI